jgi:hypothetical protein
MWPEVVHTMHNSHTTARTRVHKVRVYRASHTLHNTEDSKSIPPVRFSIRAAAEERASTSPCIRRSATPHDSQTPLRLAVRCLQRLRVVPAGRTGGSRPWCSRPCCSHPWCSHRALRGARRRARRRRASRGCEARPSHVTRREHPCRSRRRGGLSPRRVHRAHRAALHARALGDVVAVLEVVEGRAVGAAVGAAGEAQVRRVDVDVPRRAVRPRVLGGRRPHPSRWAVACAAQRASTAIAQRERGARWKWV